MSAYYVKRLKAINIMLLVCASSCVVYGLILMYFGIQEMANVIFLFSLGFLVLVYFQRKNQTRFVRSALLVFLNLFVLYFCIILSSKTDISLVFALLLILPLLFYEFSEYKKWLFYSLLSLICLVSSYYLPEFTQLEISDDKIIVLKYIVRFTLFLWVTILFYWAHYEYGKTEVVLLEKNNSLKLLLDAYQLKEEELIHSNIKLKDRYDELDRLIHIISHDLKEPMQTMLTGVQVLQQVGLDDEIKVQLQSSMAFASEELNHMYEGIRRYAEVCLLEQKEKVSINAVLNELKNNHDNSNRLKIVAHVLPNISANYEDVKVLFTELINNSIQYNTNEQIVININNISIVKNIVKLSYSDNSIGLEDKQNEVFSMFYRLSDSSVAKKRGVGLAVVKKITNFYNGSIINKPTKSGVHFELTLPIHSV